MSIPKSRPRLLPLLAPALLAACTGGDAPASGAPSADAAPATADAPAASSTGITAGRWSGDVTRGYKGNRISFVVSADGARIEDIVFTGHWDCTDGIEQTTLGPQAAFPLAGDSIQVLSVEPADGGATAQHFDMQGRIASREAEGTLRIALNALGCDTRVLEWTATPE